MVLPSAGQALSWGTDPEGKQKPVSLFLSAIILYTICCTAVSKTATSFLMAGLLSGGCTAAVPVSDGYMKITALKGNSNSSTK